MSENQLPPAFYGETDSLQVISLVTIALVKTLEARGAISADELADTLSEAKDLPEGAAAAMRLIITGLRHKAADPSRPKLSIVRTEPDS